MDQSLPNFHTMYWDHCRCQRAYWRSNILIRFRMNASVQNEDGVGQFRKIIRCILSIAGNFREATAPNR